MFTLPRNRPMVGTYTLSLPLSLTHARTHTHTHTHTRAHTHTQLERESSSSSSSSRSSSSSSSSSISSSSSSNWILMSCQPHSVTPGQSNSGHKQIHIFLNSSHIHINPLSNQSTKPITSQVYIHKSQTHIFVELVSSVSPLLKEHIRLGHAGIVDHSV